VLDVPAKTPEPASNPRAIPFMDFVNSQRTASRYVFAVHESCRPTDVIAGLLPHERRGNQPHLISDFQETYPHDG
jgi:hypothetical protein